MFLSLGLEKKYMTRHKVEIDEHDVRINRCYKKRNRTGLKLNSISYETY
ncbi:hypothetical protein Palpr_0306 [Paludibacter propionicigenes WB4]|uniref:Uncharacterized protein n=1 Tax=Paludibacter propionicigenes (strain DSM 17365 / JCM 13257 / WB4) TaxID=694427 RepID=E4T187_PALPW|nr:hypothetical protein Palpr_0306 [Paludibacter propionicigenes WB4]